MYTIYTTKTISVAHHLPGVSICERPHGHNLKVEVWIGSNLLNSQSMVCDFRDLKNTWMMYDHRDLNDYFDMPTAEIVAKVICDNIKALNLPIISIKVRVWESEDSAAEYSEQYSGTGWER